MSVLYTLTEPLDGPVALRAGDDALQVGWFPMLVDHSRLAFDHEQLIDRAYQFIRAWRKAHMPGVQELEDHSIQCMWGCESAIRCPLPAWFLVDGWATCEECVYTMANMNSDNEEWLGPALVALAERRNP